jgi:hypothetical protein
MTTHRPKNSNVNNLRGSRIVFQVSPLSAGYSILIEKVKSRPTNKKAFEKAEQNPLDIRVLHLLFFKYYKFHKTNHI